MNKRNKVILSTVGAVLLSGIAATSATLAWFQTDRNATVKYSSATVTTSGGDLGIAFKSSLNIFTSNVLTNDDLKLVGENKITDISGDGLAFYKPVWSATTGIASSIDDIVLTGTNPAEGYFIDFTITLDRGGPLTDGIKVFLGGGTKITPVNPLSTLDTGAVAASRMAVITYSDNNSVTGTPSILYLYSQLAETNATYIEKPGTGAYGSTTHGLATGVTVESTSFQTSTSISEAEAFYPAVANLMIDEEADVTFRFWIEGTDADASDDIINGVFNIDLNLYALAS